MATTGDKPAAPQSNQMIQETQKDQMDEEWMDFDGPRWADVRPVPLCDGPAPLAPIAYTQKYARAMDLFRALVANNELSIRALALTSFLISENPSHYAVWKYRLDLVRALNISPEKELEFTEDLAQDNPKSYQLWFYRQAIADPLNNPSRELDFINTMFTTDAKNYHAWAYRQHVVSKHALWARELIDIDHLIETDVRNNSAWNQRFFVVRSRCSGDASDGVLGSGDLAGEVEYALARIRLAPRNESPWNYLRGIVQQLGGKKLSDIESIETVAIQMSAEPYRVPHALSLLADIYAERGQTDECAQTLGLLAQVDSIRKKYWEYRRDQIQKTSA